MNRCKLQFMLPVLAGFALLSACEQTAETDVVSETAAVELPNGMTVKEQIEARQGHLKTISDQLKAGSPDLAQIQTAAATVPTEAMGMNDWFPEGTGPASGIKTAALPIIWEDKTDFNDKIGAMQDAAAKLDSIAQAGDVAAIGAAFKTTGGTCKGCHGKYRKDD